jgi:hypothetical protein
LVFIVVAGAVHHDGDEGAEVTHGVITLGDTSDHYYQEEEIGGKAGFLKGVVGRLGLPTGTKVAQQVAKIRKVREVSD